MATIVSQTVYAPSGDILARNYDTVRVLENSLSKTLPGSDIYRLNHEGGTVVFSSADTARVLESCLFYAEQTGGAYDPALGRVAEAWGIGGENPRVPSEEELQKLLAASGYEKLRIDGDTANAGGAWADLGGAAKGYALDAIKANLAEEGVTDALIAVGGSVYARGKKAGAAWKVGIRDPFSGAADYLATVELTDLCISTSGSYERGFTQDGTYYHHILDPKTGYPVQNGLVSVSVINENGLLTDIYSTALFVMGLEAGMKHAEEHGIDALFVTEEKKIYRTDGFDYAFTLVGEGYRIEG